MGFHSILIYSKHRLYTLIYIRKHIIYHYSNFYIHIYNMIHESYNIFALAPADSFYCVLNVFINLSVVRYMFNCPSYKFLTYRKCSLYILIFITKHRTYRYSNFYINIYNMAHEYYTRYSLGTYDPCHCDLNAFTKVCVVRDVFTTWKSILSIGCN